jgi:hypothetical protein
MVALSRDTITRRNPLYLFSYLKNFADIAVSRPSGKGRFLSWLSALGIVVDLGSDTDSGIFVFNKYPIVGDRTDLERLHFYLANVRAEQSASVHRNPFECGNVIQFADLSRGRRVHRRWQSLQLSPPVVRSEIPLLEKGDLRLSKTIWILV